MKSASDIFRRNVRALLRQREMTVQELAERTGTYQSSVSRLLNTDEGITFERAEKIAAVFDLPLRELLSERFSENPKNGRKRA